MSGGPTLLFLCGGRRVNLLERFRRTLERRGGGTILTTDTEPRAATTVVADRTFLVPPCGDSAFADAVADICEREDVAAVLPLTCSAAADLPALRGRVTARLVSGDDVSVRICTDKLATARHLNRLGVPTPALVTDPSPDDLPLFFRRRRSEASRGAFLVDRESLLAVAREQCDAVLTRFVAGLEATVDSYKDFSGHLVSSVPRRRLRVRAGEVERAVTFHDPDLLRTAATALESLTFIGPATLQAIWAREGWQVTDINLRYGGGVTLSMEAGMDSPGWLVGELAGEAAPRQSPIKWGLGMSRYDQEFYFQTEEQPESGCDEAR